MGYQTKKDSGAVMGYIRLIHSRHYDRRKGRFTSPAFSISQNGGVSIISRECIDGSERTVCAHIRKYYPERITGEPSIFWEFSDEILPDGHRIEATASDFGDECHNDIFHVQRKHLRKIIINVPISDFNICTNDSHRNLTTSDVMFE